MTDIEYLESRIRENREEINDLRKKEKNKKAAEELHGFYVSLVDSGFSEDQAFAVFMEMMKHSYTAI